MGFEEDYRMWEYWKEDKGLECALREYFPMTLSNDPEVHRLFNQYMHAKKLIECRIETLAEQQEED